MPLVTTTIGAYPKPGYVPTPDWFRTERTDVDDPSRHYDIFLKNLPDDVVTLLDKGTQQVVQEQVSFGIQIPTDGEVRRENYIYYHCRHLDGYDFGRLTAKVMRDGAWEAEVPTVTGPIQTRQHFLIRDWKVAQSATKQPVKVTIPGPLTIMDSTADAYYGNERAWATALAEAINEEVKALADAGCQHIQIDEPVFARYPERALAFGIDKLEHCFHGTPEAVVRTSHMCCGYPSVLDDDEYQKADPEAYELLAGALEDSTINAISLEDAHRPNDLSLLEKFDRTKVILGVIAIASTKIEPVDQITARLREALNHIDADRLMVAPDCGLGMLPQALVRVKLQNMCAAARAVG
ncbi:MAG: cobalamin-independent methionine synthase II family protein [Chloroflexota bacterium]